MSKKPPRDRLAEAGRCGCGARVLRGPDGTGETVTVDGAGVDAATELTAHIHGTPSYTLTWGPGLLLTRRTRTDLARRPPGFHRDRVVLAHTCPERNP